MNLINQKQTEFLKLYDSVHDRFEKYCRAAAYGGYPYEDLMNDCLLRAFDKLDSLKDRDAFLSFLIGISRRLLANASRKMKPEPTLDSVNVFDIPKAEESIKVQFLHWCLSQLPTQLKEPLILYEITGFSVREIASSMGLSESNVKKRLSRGRKQLKEIVTLEMNKEKGVKHG